MLWWPCRRGRRDRKSTRLNSSHLVISYAVFCLEKKNTRLNSSHLVISYAVFCLKKKFYAYAYPEPAGCPDAVIAPATAGYEMRMREWFLPYEAVRRATDPDAAVLAFAQSTYDAAANLGGWQRALLER